jgi:hypothetical protein
VTAWTKALLPLWGLAVVEFFLGTPLVALGVSIAVATVIMNLFRVFLFAWAGWRVVRRAGSGGWASAWAGISIMVVDHVFLKGGWFVVDHLRGLEDDQHHYLMAFYGVLISFVMFCPIAGLIGYLGGRAARSARSPPAPAVSP